MQSLLTQDYFETLVPALINKYVQYNSYDEVEPIISQTYENVIPSLDAAIGRKNENKCDIKVLNKITSIMWNDCFPNSYKEIEYEKNNYCTFKVIIDLIERKTGEKMETFSDTVSKLFHHKYLFLIHENNLK